jgi:hypothetical protein
VAWKSLNWKEKRMDFQKFANRGGFKILALSKFSAPAFSLVCYLLNCSLAGVEDVLCSSKELALMLDTQEQKVKDALEELKKSGAVSLKNMGKNNQTIRLSLEIEEWALQAKNLPKEKKGKIGVAKNISRLSPQVVPKKGVKLKSVDERSARELLMFPIQNKPRGEKLKKVEFERILEAFLERKGAAGSKKTLDTAKETQYAELLAENHPANQVIELIEKFGAEIPSLAMLAGAWMHYVERFSEVKKQEVSLDIFRKKIEAQEKKLRMLALSDLKKVEVGKLVLSSDEQLLLRIFSRHAEPRKQLYWALQTKERYPRLAVFFQQTQEFAAAPQKVVKKK